MQKRLIDPSQVKGWGIDANPKNDPVYPMKTRNNGEHAGYSWQRPTQQPVNIEILHSNERPNVTSVFGTSTPPAGLSGMIRRFAFRYSESSYGHWLPLMAADRIGIVEGVLHDLTRAKVPNVFVERGYRAEWKHNRASLMLRLGIKLALIGAAVAYLSTRKD